MKVRSFQFGTPNLEYRVSSFDGFAAEALKEFKKLSENNNEMLRYMQLMETV